MTADPTAAILLIGNEILSGKVEDENARFLTRELRALGVSLRRIEVVPDMIEEIAGSVRALALPVRLRVHVRAASGRHTTTSRCAPSPTRSRWRSCASPELEALLRAGYGERLHERDLRMADVPAGARLEYGRPDRTAPRAAPGRSSSCATSGSCRACRRSSGASSRPCASCSAPGRSTDGPCSRAPARATSRARSTRRWPPFPDVEIGSYPHPEAQDYRVKITIDGRDAARVDDALAWLAARLGEALVRTD